MKTILARMFEHMRWADEQMLTRIAAGDVAQQRMREIAAHIAAAEHVWLSRIVGKTATLPVWPDPDSLDLHDVLRANADGYRTLLDDVTDDALDTMVPYTNTRGDAFATPLVDILLHVALHGSYHRGQVALLDRTAGGTPVNTDYINYIRQS